MAPFTILVIIYFSVLLVSSLKIKFLTFSPPKYWLIGIILLKHNKVEHIEVVCKYLRL